MRVALWSNTYWPHVGGVEVLIGHFADELVARGHEVLVIANQDDPGHPARESVGSIQVVRMPFEMVTRTRDPAAFLAARLEIDRVRAAFAPDVEHLYHGAGGEISFFAMTAGRQPDSYLVSLHQSYNDERVVAEGTLHRVLAGSSSITTCSDSVRNHLVRQLPDLVDKTSTVPNSLPWPSVESVPMPFEPLSLFAAGRLTDQKGFDVAIAALARLPSPPNLVIAGRGTNEVALRNQVVSLGLQDVVSFPGWVLPRDIPHWMARATAVLMPSRWEPFGLVALQAAQAGRPVIASRVEGLLEVVVDGETGLFVPPDDPDALAEAIRVLIVDRARAIAMGRTAARHALQAFPWEGHVDAFERLYRAACLRR